MKFFSSFLESSIFSLLFSLAIVLSRRVVINGTIWSNNQEAFIQTLQTSDLLYLAGSFVVVQLLLHGILWLLKNRKQPTGERTVSWKAFLGFAASLFAIYIPCLLSYYPGGIYSDTTHTLAMANGSYPLTNHHPVPYTFLWKFFMMVQNALHLDDYKMIFMVTVFQTLCMALAASYFLCSIYRRMYPTWLVAVSYVYFAFFPLIPLYLVSLWKDTPFAIIFLVFSTYLFNRMESTEEEMKLFTVKGIIIFSILSYLLSFSRNNGFYVFIAFSLIFLLYQFLRKDRLFRKKYIVLLLLLNSVFIFIRGPVYNYYRLNENDKVESAGIPMQQVAHVLVNHGQFSWDDLMVLNQIMPLEEWKKNYCPLIVDSFKWSSSFSKEAFNEHFIEFMKVYLHTIKKNPVLSIHGFLLANEGFWDINRQTGDAYICNFMVPNTDYIMTDKVETLFHHSIRSFYQPKTLYSSAIFAWFLFAAFTLCLMRKNRKAALVLTPGMILWFTTLIATPIAFSLRYIYPLVLLVPLDLAALLSHPEE